MSQENVEIVRQMYEAHNRGGPDAAERYWATDIEMVDAPEFPDASRQVGATQVREMLRKYEEDVGWNGRFDVQQYIDGEPEVLVVWRMTRFGPASGIPGSLTYFHVCQVEDGKVKRLRQLLSRDQALDAVGLSE